MADESSVLRGINWREAFPFAHLFRAFRIAIHPSKLVLGLVLLLSLYAGGRILDGLWPARHLAVPGEVFLYEQARASGVGHQFAGERKLIRDTTEQNYAKRLQDEKIVPDAAAAQEAAEDGDELDDLKAKIIEQRDAAVEKADQDKNVAIGD